VAGRRADKDPQAIRSRGDPDRRFGDSELMSADNGQLRVLLVGLWHHLSSRRRWQFVLVFGLVLVSAGAEVVTLGAVLPFIGILTAPERVYSYPVVSTIAERLGISAAEELILPLTVAFVIVALLAGLIRLLLLWVSTQLAVATSADLSSDVYRRTLHQPYSVHAALNSSEVISGITSKLDAVASGVLLPMLSLMGSLVLIVAVAVALVLIDPVVAIIGVAGFGGCYAAITLAFRRQLQLNSLLVAQEQTRVVRCLQEGMGGIRDILLDGTQPFFTEVYERSDRQFRRARGNNAVISGCPRYAMEALGMVLIAVLAFAMSRGDDGLVGNLPVLGALAIGGQRLLPAMQQAYAAWTGLIGSRAMLAEVMVLVSQPMPNWSNRPLPPPLSLERQISFDSVSFRYMPDGPLVLDDLSIEIACGTSVGLVGGTGGGKSTALDLLMGLLEPTSGAVLIDGEPLGDSRMRSWQQSVAHVPQHIYLADSTLAENIAFGVPRDQIDMDRVRESARLAAIADFIESRTDGYAVSVGERGIKLSGGQRQRIGVARALYKRSGVLILDEATSALDLDTERQVMESIARHRTELTLVVVAHRLPTIEGCDSIFQITNGRLAAKGTYEELMDQSPSFRRLARAVEA
jgi:ATP-binding cassette, subfamily B, bacterial PglK